jgi:hypothetical protein
MLGMLCKVLACLLVSGIDTGVVKVNALPLIAISDDDMGN